MKVCGVYLAPEAQCDVLLGLLLQRLFVVPANPRQKEIPFARVNHNKYMVTDKIAYIGEVAFHLLVSIYNTHKL